MNQALDDWRRLASEQILGDESLTDDVDDDAAEALIKWGLAQVAAIAARLAAPGMRAAPPASETSGEASRALDEQGHLVRKIIKDAGRLAARRADLTPDEWNARLASLAAMSATLQGASSAGVQASPEPAESLDLQGVTSDREAVTLLLHKLLPSAQPEQPPDEPAETHHNHS